MHEKWMPEKIVRGVDVLLRSRAGSKAPQKTSQSKPGILRSFYREMSWHIFFLYKPV
jgi:hypothetical protein